MKWWMFFCMMIIAGCSSDKIPEDVLSPEKMKPIVWDLMLADQLIMQEAVYKGKNTTLYDQVFIIHETDKKTFYRSFEFYEGRPNLLKTLMDSVSAYGSRERGELYAPRSNK